MPIRCHLGLACVGGLFALAAAATTGCSAPRATPPAHLTTPAVRHPEMRSWFGSTPTLDGILSPGEWADAARFEGVREWVPEFSPVERDADLSLTGWVKHDEHWLYFAFEVTDDVLYGIGTPRWLPGENPKAHELSRDGFPWFGDELEILVNGPNRWVGDEDADGTAASWQMVCNLTKSRLGGIGGGGLMEGEPRSAVSAWNTYRGWIEGGVQRAVAKVRPDGHGYVVEWAVRLDPCIEPRPGHPYAPGDGIVGVGLNVAVGDLDRPGDGTGNFGGFHHEQWWAGAPHTRTHKSNLGTLWLMGHRRRP